MGIVQVQLPDGIKEIIDREIAEGRASSEAGFIADALRLYVGHLEAEEEIAAMAQRADADVAAGRYVTVSSPKDNDALHQRTMDRLRSNLVSDTLAPQAIGSSSAPRMTSTASCSQAPVSGALKPPSATIS